MHYTMSWHHQVPFSILVSRHDGSYGNAQEEQLSLCGPSLILVAEDQQFVDLQGNRAPQLRTLECGVYPYPQIVLALCTYPRAAYGNLPSHLSTLQHPEQPFETLAKHIPGHSSDIHCRFVRRDVAPIGRY